MDQLLIRSLTVSAAEKMKQAQRARAHCQEKAPEEAPLWDPEQVLHSSQQDDLKIHHIAGKAAYRLSIINHKWRL